MILQRLRNIRDGSPVFSLTNSPMVRYLSTRVKPKHISSSVERLGPSTRYALSNQPLNAWQYFWARTCVTHSLAGAVRLPITATDSEVPDFPTNLALNLASYSLTALRNQAVESVFRRTWTFDWKKYFDSHDQSTLWQLVAIPIKTGSDLFALGVLGAEFNGWEHRAVTFLTTSLSDMTFTIGSRLVRQQAESTGFVGIFFEIFLQKFISSLAFTADSGAWFFIYDKALVGTPMASLVDSFENVRRMAEIKSALEMLYGAALQRSALKRGVFKIFTEMPVANERLYKEPQLLQNYIAQHYSPQDFLAGKKPYRAVWAAIHSYETIREWLKKTVKA